MATEGRDWMGAAARFGMDIDEAARQTLNSLSRRRNQLIKKAHPDKGGNNEKAQEINDAYAVLRNWIREGKPGLTGEPTGEEPADTSEAEPPPSQTPPQPQPPPAPPPGEPPPASPPPAAPPGPAKGGRPVMLGRFYQRRAFRIVAAVALVGAAVVHQFWTGGRLTIDTAPPVRSSVARSPAPLPTTGYLGGPYGIAETPNGPVLTYGYISQPLSPELPPLLRQFNAKRIELVFTRRIEGSPMNVKIEPYTNQRYFDILPKSQQTQETMSFLRTHFTPLETRGDAYILKCRYWPDNPGNPGFLNSFWYRAYPPEMKDWRMTTGYPFPGLGPPFTACPIIDMR